MLNDHVMERLLDDWGWWVRARSHGGMRCCSAEGRYRPERVDEEPQARRMVDEATCMAVERAVSHPDFPVSARGLLKGWYVLRVAREQIARRVHIPMVEFDLAMKWAVTILKNRLDISIRPPNIRTDNSIPPEQVSSPPIRRATFA